LYYRSSSVSADDLRLMRWLDERFLRTPVLQSRRMAAVMRRDGLVVNRKRVKRAMRLMGNAGQGSSGAAVGMPDEGSRAWWRLPHDGAFLTTAAG
jgi:hypothetical protein